MDTDWRDEATAEDLINIDSDVVVCLENQRVKNLKTILGVLTPSFFDDIIGTCGAFVGVCIGIWFIYLPFWDYVKLLSTVGVFNLIVLWTVKKIERGYRLK